MSGFAKPLKIALGLIVIAGLIVVPMNFNRYGLFILSQWAVMTHRRDGAQSDARLCRPGLAGAGRLRRHRRLCGSDHDDAWLAAAGGDRGRDRA